MSTVQEWGPAAWKFLHAMTFSFPDAPTIQQQTDAERLFASLRTLLPCEACRVHYDQEISVHPPDVRSRSTLSAWLVDLHNRVNARLGKPIFTFAAAESLYSSQCSADCHATPPTKKRAADKNKALQKGLRALMTVLLLVVVVLLAFSKRR